MSFRLLFALLLPLAAAAPAYGQEAKAAPPPQPSAEACTPEHAEMGHCVPSGEIPTPPPPARCTPEHARLGHCTPEAAAPAPTPADACTPERAEAGQCMPSGEIPHPPAADPCTPEHARMGHCTPATPAAPPGAGPPGASGTALPAGSAPPPPPPRDRAADRFYPAEAMAEAEAEMRQEHGGVQLSQIGMDFAEARLRDGHDRYFWDGEAWFGGDINKLVLKNEGEGEFGGELEEVLLQALYARAIGPYFDLLVGVRQDLRPGPDRTYAAAGLEGLAPYWIETEAFLFLSDKGDLLATLEAFHDARLTQRLVLQPHAVLKLAAQDVEQGAIGSGFYDLDLGLRLRYEIRPELGPYLGVVWERLLGETADLARAAGDDVESTSLALGVAFWF